MTAETNTDEIIPWPDLKMEDFGEPELIAGGFLFTEGPVWNARTGELYFSDIAGNTIYRLSWPSSAVEIFRRPSQHANGLAFDRQGCLLAAERE